VENIAFFAHVGDSRAYLVKEDALKPMTQDHSLVNRLLEAGAISEEEATSHPQRNIIYRSIGQGQDLQTDWRTTDITPGSQILLCSDGLWGSVEDEDILATIKKAGNPQLACQQLVALAREQGSIDDITILLIPWDYERNGH
jgi:protein phosphatase